MTTKENTEAQADQPEDEARPRRMCGNCRFTEPAVREGKVDLSIKICHGTQAKPVITPAGRQMWLYPIVGIRETPCPTHRYPDEPHYPFETMGFMAYMHEQHKPETKN